MPECIFCDIIQGKLKSFKITEDENHLVIMDLFPAVKGHILIIPKKHYETIIDIPKKDLESLISTVQRIANAVVKSLSPDGYKIIQNNKKAAGQSIPHVHVHIIPRYHNDGFPADWGRVGKYDNEEEIQMFCNKIKNSL